jgi:glycosyltransferase involved in cell wall biosynthesis
LILSSWYPNHTAPFLGNFVKRQAEVLSNRFYVTVLFTVSNATLSEQSIELNEQEFLKEIIIYHPKGRGLLSRFKQQRKAFEKGLSLINNVDLIHAHVILSKGHLFVKAKKFFNCPMVLTEHGSYFRKDKREKLSLKERMILKFTVKKMDRILAVSSVLQSDMLDYFGNLSVDVVPNSIDTNFFSPHGKVDEKKPFTFLHISTLDVTTKNPRGIIDATKMLFDSGHSNFKVKIASDEPYEHLLEYVKSMKLDDYIEFSGPHLPQEILALYKSSDAFILFSDYETFSIVLVEAMACGLPVISTPVGIAKNLPASCGIQVEIGETQSLAKGMEKLLLNNDFDCKVIRSFAQQFSDELILERLTAIYHDLVN